MSLRGIPGFSGIMGIIVGLIAVSVVVSLISDSNGHWPFVIAGILVGLWAVQSINK